MKIMCLYCHFILEENEDFEAVVLLRSTLWTALVVLHDSERFGLEKKATYQNCVAEIFNSFINISFIK